MTHLKVQKIKKLSKRLNFIYNYIDRQHAHLIPCLEDELNTIIRDIETKVNLLEEGLDWFDE